LEDGAIRIQFSHVGGGLASRNRKPLNSFEIAGNDGVYVPAEAKIEGDTVVVSASRVPKPDAVRFAWSEIAQPNLMNKQDLPAAPFRTRRDEDLTSRSVLAYRVKAFVDRSDEARAAGDNATAAQLLESALSLDPESPLARLRKVRLLLATGLRQEAIELARQYDLLLSVPLLKTRPVVDGDPDESAWKGAFAAPLSYKTTSSPLAMPASGKTDVRIGHKDSWLFVAMIGYETDLDRLVVTKTQRDSEVWRDDCVELVFDPANSEKDFIQFIINPAGTLQDVQNWDGGKDFDVQVRAKVFPDRGYWAAELAVRTEVLAAKSVSGGSIWSMNFFRHRASHDGEHTALWPCYGGALHPEYFPIAVFATDD